MQSAAIVASWPAILARAACRLDGSAVRRPAARMGDAQLLSGFARDRRFCPRRRRRIVSSSSERGLACVSASDESRSGAALCMVQSPRVSAAIEISMARNVRGRKRPAPPFPRPRVGTASRSPGVDMVRDAAVSRCCKFRSLPVEISLTNSGDAESPATQPWLAHLQHRCRGVIVQLIARG